MRRDRDLRDSDLTRSPWRPFTIFFDFGGASFSESEIVEGCQVLYIRI